MNAAATAHRPGIGSPVRILHAEDQPIVAESVILVLKSAGFEVDTVADGEAALACLRDRPDHYHLLLTDSNMPRLCGVELVRQVRRLEFSGKIIILSGCLNDREEAAFRELGVNGILYKPYDAHELPQTIRRVLGG